MEQKKWKSIIVLTFNLSILLVSFSFAQPPGTDLYITDISVSNNRINLSEPVNITNRAGYDNQPFFHPNGKYLLYTSSQNQQTDIYSYDLSTKTTSQITQTPESEYSPTVMPGGNFFSTIRVENDSKQRLWKFPIDGGTPALVLEKVAPVGYHAWANQNTVFLFVLGDPATLQVADTNTGTAKTVVGNIGRSIHKIPGKDAISFVHKLSQEPWFITSISIQNREIDYLTKTLPGSEDYAWTPDGRIVMGNNSKLFEFVPGKTKSWQEVADFSSVGIKNITRISVSTKGDRIVFVARDGE